MMDIVKRLQLAADDPMWANHSEVSKSTLCSAADIIDQLRAERDQLKARVGELEAECESLKASVYGVYELEKRITELEAQLKGRDGWESKASAWLRGKVAEQEQINEQYPNHAKCYPSWTERVVTMQRLAGELDALIAAAPKCKRCEGRGIVPIGDGYSVNPCPDCATPKGE